MKLWRIIAQKVALRYQQVFGCDSLLEDFSER